MTGTHFNAGFEPDSNKILAFMKFVFGLQTANLNIQGVSFELSRLVEIFRENRTRIKFSKVQESFNFLVKSQNSLSWPDIFWGFFQPRNYIATKQVPELQNLETNESSRQRSMESRHDWYQAVWWTLQHLGIGRRDELEFYFMMSLFLLPIAAQCQE